MFHFHDAIAYDPRLLLMVSLPVRSSMSNHTNYLCYHLSVVVMNYLISHPSED
jgi:hypothetical protein